MGANNFNQSKELLKFVDTIDSKAIKAIRKRSNNFKIPIESLIYKRGLSLNESLGVILLSSLRTMHKPPQKGYLR